MDDSGEKQPFVSILTPVYNGEKYLDKCIESVLEQTHENWEYVIVNNCSTDRSLEIAQKYAQLDKRIRVHNNEEFLAQMPNLNHAFRQISSESKYCKVIHADDWMFPECIEEMVAIGEQYPQAGIVGSYRLDERTVKLDGLPYPSHVTSGKEICRRYLLDGLFLFGSPSSLLIRSDLIRKRDKMYDESHLHGDLWACFDILKESDFGFVHKVLTFTRRHNESMTSSVKRFETHRVGRLKILLEFGPHYLTEEEMEKRVSSKLKSHYSFLAKKFFELKPKEFWEYHASELKSLGMPLRYGRLVANILGELLNFRIIFGKFREALRAKYSKQQEETK